MDSNQNGITNVTTDKKDEVTQQRQNNQTNTEIKQETTASDDMVKYRVQFLIEKNPLPENDPKFKGVTGYSYYQQDGTIRYTKGDETNVEKAQEIAKELKEKGFKGAFIVPFYKGERISGYEAKKINETKNKQ